jgi:hypothetical protein
MLYGRRYVEKLLTYFQEMACFFEDNPNHLKGFSSWLIKLPSIARIVGNASRFVPLRRFLRVGTGRELTRISAQIVGHARISVRPGRLREDS